MAKSSVMKAVRFFHKCLDETGINVSRLILFGSHTTGAARADSDIDIIIISEDFRKKNIFQRAEMTKYPEIATIKKFHVPMDIITLTPEEFESETSLIATFAKDGKVIFAA